MTFGSILDSVRNHYLKHFREVLREKRHVPATRVITEPALRGEDGEVVREGTLNLPMRVDLVVRAELQEDENVRITCDDRCDFEPLTVTWADALEIDLHPFRWEECPVLFPEVPEGDPWWPMVEWFEKWFDEFDAKAALKKDVQEVVHFLSDPEIEDGQALVQVDFGSAPVEAFEEFLDALSRTGVKRVQIGEPQEPSAE